MSDNAFGGFFLSEGDDELIEDEELVTAEVVVPGAPSSRPSAAPPQPQGGPVPVPISVPEVRPEPAYHRPTREERLAAALPPEMEDDRVGAMSAAILGLGERAAAELGRGALTQVFIEGERGYVMLIAAGDRAVLTCIADVEAKLGLVLYDMRDAADTIAEILG